MATGPEHYHEAERLEAAAKVQLQEVQRGTESRVLTTTPEVEMMTGIIDATLAMAQVHATLALAAAMAEGDRADPDLEWPAREKLNEEWGKVLAP